MTPCLQTALEYYLYDPDDITLDGWHRVGGRLEKIPQVAGWTSPLLGITFDMNSDELRVFGRNAEEFVSPSEAVRQRNEACKHAERLAAQRRALGIEPEA